MASEKKSTDALWGLTLLRMVVGWHFLYEGLWKFAQSGWSAVEYLRLSRWIGAPVFQWIAEQPAVLKVCDQLTMWGLVLIGLGLLSGMFARVAAAFGVLMLAFFYIAQPPFLTVGGAHHFLFLDYNAIEAVALLAVVCSPGEGLWTVAKGVWAKIRKAPAAEDVQVAMPARREVLAGTLFGILVALVVCGVWDFWK